MAKCFIHGSNLIDHNGKQACLKVYRDKDNKELSIVFDNSLSAFGDECKRIEARIFQDKESVNCEKVVFISDSKDLAKTISDFVSGKD